MQPWTAAWDAAALAGYYALIVIILMDGRVVLAHYAEFIAYSNTAEQLAIAAGVAILTGGRERTVSQARTEVSTRRRGH